MMKHPWLDLLLLICILLSLDIINSLLVYINVLEAVIGNGSSMRISVSSKTKDRNVKAFNITTNRNEVKTLIKHISCNCKCKFNSAKCNSNKKWNKKTCQCESKNYHICKRNCIWNPKHVFVRMVII